jgi:hypothetical protein
LDWQGVYVLVIPLASILRSLSIAGDKQNSVMIAICKYSTGSYFSAVVDKLSSGED